MESLQKLIPFCLFLCYFCVYISNGISFEQDLTLTPQEKMALDKFKRKVEAIVPPRNLNLEQAEQMLRSNLRWRREQKMDTIQNEDWSSMTENFPYSSDKRDLLGRPIGTVNLGTWNLRRIALAEKMPRLQRYLNKLLEEGYQLVLQEQYKGKNVTQFKILLNLDGFNEIQHACPICLPAYTGLVSTYEARYPGYCDQAIHINTPPVYDIVLNAIRPLFSPPTRKVLKFFGTDKSEWMNYLDKEISRDQRRVEYGGICVE